MKTFFRTLFWALFVCGWFLALSRLDYSSEPNFQVITISERWIKSDFPCVQLIHLEDQYAICVWRDWDEEAQPFGVIYDSTEHRFRVQFSKKRGEMPHGPDDVTLDFDQRRY